MTGYNNAGKNNPMYGRPSPFKGKKHTPEELKKMSEALMGEKNPMYGKKHSKETLEKMRQIKVGKKFTEEHKRKMAESKWNENNPQWKGDDVGYPSLHLWVRSRLPEPELCQMCNKVPPYDLANISGKYKRDLTDWQYLCRRCHMKLDYKNGIRIWTRNNAV